MRRVVVTGLGIVSSIGNNAEEVTDSLRHARSGIVTADFQFSLGLQNQPRRDQHGAQGQKPNDTARAIDARDPEHAVLLRATASAGGVDLYA